MVPPKQNLLIGVDSDSPNPARPGMRFLPAIALILAFAAGCGGEEHNYVPNASDGNTTPTMATSDVSTLISDSGYTRYHIEAPLWLMFEDAEEPFWRFPEGLAMEQYDLQMNPAANVICDSAVYFSRKRLWRLDGRVVMVNTDRDSFLTEQLFWDQNSRKIYSDSFIHIVRTDRVIEGYGFESDQNMESYTVSKPTAILPAQRPAKNHIDSTEADTAMHTPLSTDTVAAKSQRQRKQRRANPNLRVATLTNEKAK